MKLQIIFFLLIVSLLTSCSSWELEKTTTDWYSIMIPKGSTIKSHQDDYGIYATIENTTNTQFVIEILPVEAPLQKTFDIIGKKYSFKKFSSSTTIPFDWGNTKGIMEDISDEYLRGETYCFHKNGSTVIISSYGLIQDYKSIEDIVSSIEIISSPYDEEQMNNFISQFEKDAPIEAKSAIQNMLPTGYECRYARLIDNGKDYTIECTLTGDYSYTELLLLTQKIPKVSTLMTVLEHPSFGPYFVYAPHIMKAELFGVKTLLRFIDSKGQTIELKTGNRS